MAAPSAAQRAETHVFAEGRSLQTLSPAVDPDSDASDALSLSALLESLASAMAKPTPMPRSAPLVAAWTTSTVVRPAPPPRGPSSAPAVRAAPSDPVGGTPCCVLGAAAEGRAAASEAEGGSDDIESAAD